MKRVYVITMRLGATSRSLDVTRTRVDVTPRRVCPHMTCRFHKPNQLLSEAAFSVN